MKRVLKLMIIPILIVAALGFYQYNKPHKDIKQSSTDFQMAANSLFTEYELNENSANQKYLDKMIEVSGEVRELTEKDGILSISLNTDSDMFGVICQMDEHAKHDKKNIEIGQKITLKGICTGMLMDVVLVRCIQI